MLGNTAFELPVHETIVNDPDFQLINNHHSEACSMGIRGAMMNINTHLRKNNVFGPEKSLEPMQTEWSGLDGYTPLPEPAAKGKASTKSSVQDTETDSVASSSRTAPLLAPPQPKKFKKSPGSSDKKE